MLANCACLRVFSPPVPRSVKLKMIGLARSLIKQEVEAPGEVILFLKKYFMCGLLMECLCILGISEILLPLTNP